MADVDKLLAEVEQRLAGLDAASDLYKELRDAADDLAYQKRQFLEARKAALNAELDTAIKRYEGKAQPKAPMTFEQFSNLPTEEQLRVPESVKRAIYQADAARRQRGG